MLVDIRSIDVGRYRHNYEGFYEKFAYQIHINGGRTTTTQGAYARLLGILSFFIYIFSLSKEL